MAYQVNIAPRAIRQLRRVQAQERRRIEQRIAALSENPRPPGYRALRNLPYFRIRVGNYRVIYDIQDDVLRVLVVLIGHRRNIYQQLDRL